MTSRSRTISRNGSPYRPLCPEQDRDALHQCPFDWLQRVPGADHTGSAGADISGEGAEAGLGQSSSEHGFGEDSEEPARRDCRQRAPEPVEQD